MQHGGLAIGVEGLGHGGKSVDRRIGHDLRVSGPRPTQESMEEEDDGPEEHDAREGEDRVDYKERDRDDGKEEDL